MGIKLTRVESHGNSSWEDWQHDQTSAGNHLLLSEMQHNLRNKNLTPQIRIQMDKFKLGVQF